MAFDCLLAVPASFEAICDSSTSVDYSGIEFIRKGSLKISKVFFVCLLGLQSYLTKGCTTIFVSYFC